MLFNLKKLILVEFQRRRAPPPTLESALEMQAAMKNAAAMSLKNSAVISTHTKISYGKIIHACSVVEQNLSTHFH